MKIFVLSMSIICFAGAGRSEDGPHAKTPPAILESSVDKGIRLSQKAQQTIGLATVMLGDLHEVPTDALIYYQDHIGVYRLRSGWFKLIEIQRPEIGATRTRIHTQGLLLASDQIVVAGVGLLRVAEMEATEGNP